MPVSAPTTFSAGIGLVQAPATLGFVCQLSTANPNAVTQTWQDITPYVLDFHITRAKQRQLQRFEAASMDISLRNDDRRFDPTYTGSPYYPNLLPMRQIRFGFIQSNVITWEYTGYVERWPQLYQGPTWAQVDLTCVDGFELVANHFLASAYAKLTTALTGSNNDLVFSAVQNGFLGNSTTITYFNPGSGTNTLSVNVVGTDITVNLGTISGSISSSANDVLTAIQASTTASALVTVALAAGNDGTGLVTAMATTALSGGTFAQQTTGAFVNQIFDYIGWNGQRVISAGQSQVQAQAITIDAGATALDSIYAATSTEDGQFFFDGQGRPTFLDRTTLASSSYRTARAIFTDHPNDTTTFGYQDLRISWDKDLIFNDVHVTRENGLVQDAKDDTSNTQYFTRSLTLSGILSISDAEALSVAQSLLLRYKQPLLRFEPVKLFPGKNNLFWAALLALELLDTVTIKRTPPGAPEVISQDVAVIGIEIQGAAGPVENITWTLSIDPVGSQPFFILDDPVYGLLDSNSLGY